MSRPPSAGALPRLTDASLAALLAAERAVVVLVRSGCDACDAYEADLARHRAAGELPGIALGALAIDADDAPRFTRAHAAWLADLDFLPSTLLYARGRLVEEFATTHAAYLVARVGTTRGGTAG
jgi:hypothetical protein